MWAWGALGVCIEVLTQVVLIDLGYIQMIDIVSIYERTKVEKEARKKTQEIILYRTEQVLHLICSLFILKVFL